MRTQGRGQSVILLLDVVDVLRAEKIDYAVIGAVAASVHGAVRVSKDADVLLSAAVLDGPKIECAFKDAGFRTKLNRGDLEDDIPGLLRVNDQFGNQVDLLLGLRRLDPKAFSRTIEVALQGSPLQFIGREDFIAMKVYAGGPVCRRTGRPAGRRERHRGTSRYPGSGVGAPVSQAVRPQ